MPWPAALTLAIAVLGAVLGVLNTWSSISQRQLHLRVTPAHAFATSGAQGFAIEVVNLNAFAVTVTEVGFILGRSRSKRPRRLYVADPLIIDHRPWPRRLEPREAVSVYFDPDPFKANRRQLGKAYALISCGEIVRGDSGAARQLRQGG